MATTLKLSYGTTNQSLTITLNSLANSTTNGRSSVFVDNTVNLFIDALLAFKTKTGPSGVSATGFVQVFAYGTADNATYSDNIAGTDSAFTPTAPPNLKLIGIMNAVASTVSYIAGPFSVASAFNGTLPDQWGIYIQNQSGAALSATTTDHAVFYQGVQAQSV